LDGQELEPYELSSSEDENGLQLMRLQMEIDALIISSSCFPWRLSLDTLGKEEVLRSTEQAL